MQDGGPEGGGKRDDVAQMVWSSAASSMASISAL
jgi:hypothetical protein